MTIADDLENIVTAWGQVLTAVRNTPTYGTSGEHTQVWASIGTPQGAIFPKGGLTKREVPGIKDVSTHDVFVEIATVVVAGDRIRPAGWAAGDDEHEVLLVENYLSQYQHCHTRLVVGHAG